MIEADDAVRQIVEQGLEVIVEERQPVLLALIAPAAGDALVERIGTGDTEAPPPPVNANPVQGAPDTGESAQMR